MEKETLYWNYSLYTEEYYTKSVLLCTAYSPVQYRQSMCTQNMARMRSLIMILLPLFSWFLRHLHCLELFRFELTFLKSCTDIGCDGVPDPRDQ